MGRNLAVVRLPPTSEGCAVFRSFLRSNPSFDPSRPTVSVSSAISNTMLQVVGNDHGAVLQLDDFCEFRENPLKFGIPSLGLLLGAPVSRPIGVRNGVYLPGIGAGMAPSDPRRRGPMLLQDRGSLPRDRQCLRVVALPPRYDNNCHSVSSSILFCFRYDIAPSQ